MLLHQSVSDERVQTSAASFVSLSFQRITLKSDPVSDFSFCCQRLQILCGPEGVRVELDVEKVFFFFFSMNRGGEKYSFDCLILFFFFLLYVLLRLSLSAECKA